MYTQEEKKRIAVIGIATADLGSADSKAVYHHFEEFKQLVSTANIQPDERLYMRIRSIDKSFFFTKGKRQEVVEFCHKNEIDEVVISASLSTLQQRNLEDAIGCTVFDRTELIIHIFRQAAHSAEGKIQTEMAYLQHLKTRLAGRGKELAQQEGFVGGRGPGETEKEKLRRYYEEKLRQAAKKLNTVAKSREVQRKRRLKSGLPLFCLIGYTNAGKSSLLNSLTKSDILAEDKLFATLDTTTRELYLSDDHKPLLSDTVGFINQLPPKLIEAFKSTLDELRYADLLLHVVDISNNAWQDHLVVVNTILKELGVAKKPQLLICNKVDLLDDEEKEAVTEQLRQYSESFNDILLCSALDATAVQNLKEKLHTFLLHK